MSSPEMSKRLKNVLEEEWNFTKLVCPHVRGGEANAGNWFWCVSLNFILQQNKTRQNYPRRFRAPTVEIDAKLCIFSVMASSLLRSITDFMESGMDEEINSLYDTTMGDSYEDLEMLARRNSRSIEIRFNFRDSCDSQNVAVVVQSSDINISAFQHLCWSNTLFTHRTAILSQ